MADSYIYILISEKSSKTYTGATDNLEKRLSEHNSGSNHFSRKYKPWKIFYTERFDNRIEALEREKYLKSHAGRKFIKTLFKK
jgi:putative endonuclease